MEKKIKLLELFKSDDVIFLNFHQDFDSTRLNWHFFPIRLDDWPDSIGFFRLDWIFPTQLDFSESTGFFTLDSNSKKQSSQSPAFNFH